MSTVFTPTRPPAKVMGSPICKVTLAKLVPRCASTVPAKPAQVLWSLLRSARLLNEHSHPIRFTATHSRRQRSRAKGLARASRCCGRIHHNWRSGECKISRGHQPRAKPDIILLDIHIPDGTGLDACRRILRRSPDSRILVLTSEADERLAIKPFAPEHTTTFSKKSTPKPSSKPSATWLR